MLRSHVYHLIPAYVHHQLQPEQAARVLRHVGVCSDCRAALDREQQLAREIARTMPLIGRPRRGQLARLWPAIWLEFRTPRGKRGQRWLPSYSLALGVIMLGVFAVSALFAGTTQAIAAPFQPAPTELRATATLTVTDQPSVDQPQASETASVLIVPKVSPVPLAGTGVARSVRYSPGS